MALKTKFANALATRTGMTPQAAEVALGHVIELLKTKVPPAIGSALDKMMNSDNGVDPKTFLLEAATDAVKEKAIEVVEDKAGEVIEALEERIKSSWEERQSNRPMGVIVKTGTTQLLNWFRSLFNKKG